MTDDQLRQARTFIVEQFQGFRPRLLEAFGNIAEQMKDDATPVTDLDKQIERELRVALANFDSGIGFIGEEFGQTGNTETFWLVDPIDGTESFIRGIPSPRNMVTLIDHGTPVLTLVYKFVTDELFTAIRGQGAYKNGQPIHTSQRSLDRMWMEIATPLSEPAVASILAPIRKVINGYRVSGDFTLSVEGKIDALLVYKVGGGDWDYAPRGLLFQEAGAKVANIGSDTYDYRNHDFLAAPAHVFDQLMAIINQYA